MTFVGAVMILLGFVMASSEPLEDWKVLWGFSLLIVGVLCVVLSIL